MPKKNTLRSRFALLFKSVENVVVKSSYSPSSSLYPIADVKLSLSGGTMTGDINSMNIIPKANTGYNLGASNLMWNYGYFKDVLISNDIYHSNINQKYIYSNGNSVREIRAMSKDTADGIWNSLPTNTLVFCW